MWDENLQEWEEFEALASAQETPPANSFKADPYASIRSALAPEHANLLPEEVPLFLGRMPAALALDQYLSSSEMHQAALAGLLGTGARRSVRVDESEVSIPAFLRLVSRLCREVAEQTEIESRGEREFAEDQSLRPRYREEFETAQPGDTEGESFELEIPLQESEFRPDRLPQAVRNEFSKTDSAAWRQAMLQAIASGVRNTAALADLIFFMQHRDRVVRGVGQSIKSDEPAFAKLQAEWDLYETIANRHLNPSRPRSIFLPANPSSDYEKYLARPTTGLITLMVNGRTSGRDQIEAFDSMRQTVESLGRGDSLFVANWQFMPTAAPLTTPPSGRTWADLLKKKASDGVRIRVIISDLPPAAAAFQTNLKPLDDVIDALPASGRDNWKYIFSPHPAHMTASHHQKVLVATKGQTVVAFCGGLDISVNRIPVPKNSFVWHDVHAKLEGLIARDIEREFVLRWNREKDNTTAPTPLTWKELERLTPAALSRSDASPSKNKHKLQMLRTVSVGWDRGERRRTDIWQGYFRLIGSATRFLFLENQYFHEPAMADAIVKQVEDQPDLIVIIVVSTVSDDKKSPITENMHALRHEFLSRLSRIPKDRLGVYTMKGSLVHSKLIMADDRALSMGSANANPRDFFLDTQLNVMLDDTDAVRNFRRHLWAHDLGVAEPVVAAWTVPEFISQWNAVANANDVLNATSRPMPGEGILLFDRTKHAKDVGQRLPLLDIFSEQENEPSSENDTETPLALEAESQLPLPQTSGEVFDPLNPPKDIASALQAKDWARALGQAIQVGMRDENALTNLIFFGKHPELPRAPLDPKNPKFEQLSSEWMQILNGEVWTAIKAASENTALVVSGEEVASNDHFFWGTSGKRLKKLVEDAAKEVGLNPGLLGNIIMAETQSPGLYLTSGKVSSYDVGTDDFFEGRAAIAARVPAFKKVKWDTKQTPVAHPNDAITPREVKTILFDSGPDALLATAVYAKFREVRLREIAKDMKQDFDALPIETRFALTRMAMAAGTRGVTPLLKNALAGRDILIRKAIPVVIYQTQRNGTVRTAQAMHLSEWIFGIKVLPSTQPAQKVGTFCKAQQLAPSQSQKQEAGESRHAFESLTEEAEFSSASEQTPRSWTGSPYIGQAEMLDSIEEHEDPPPRGLVLLDHMHISKTADLAVAGGFRIATTPTVLKPSDMNPGFIDVRDELITDRSPFGLQTCLDHTITSQFSRFLASKSATKADSRDRVRIGIVDLTGAKLAKPEFAGWGSTVAMYGASSPKMLAIYAAFQLRRDLRQMAEDQAIPSGKELAAFASKTWKDKKLSSGLPDLISLFDINHWSGQPNDLNFTPDARAAFAHISNNAAASLVIHAVGFPYIASVAWQSGLRHAFRGGLWLSRAYDGTDGWVNNPFMKAPAFVHNITGLAVATFFTLLAQGRLVDDVASAEIMTVLKLSPLGGGCKSCLFPSGITLEATKCGIFKPFMHDCILARHSGTRYTAAILTEIDATWHADGLCPTGGETGLYTDLCEAMDNLIQANNRPTRSACG